MVVRLVMRLVLCALLCITVCLVNVTCCCAHVGPRDCVLVCFRTSANAQHCIYGVRLYPCEKVGSYVSTLFLFFSITSSIVQVYDYIGNYSLSNDAAHTCSPRPPSLMTPSDDAGTYPDTSLMTPPDDAGTYPPTVIDDAP